MKEDAAYLNCREIVVRLDLWQGHFSPSQVCIKETLVRFDSVAGLFQSNMGSIERHFGPNHHMNIYAFVPKLAFYREKKKFGQPIHICCVFLRHCMYYYQDKDLFTIILLLLYSSTR